MEIKQLIIENFGTLLTSLLSGGFGIAWFFERKKNKAITNQEVAKASQEEATALTGMRAAYKEFTEDMNQKYNELNTELKDLKQKLIDVSSKLNEEQNKYLTLMNAYEKLKHSYETLKRNFDDYKKKNK